MLIHPYTSEIRGILLAAGPPPETGPVVHWRFRPVLDIKRGFDSAGHPKVLLKDLRHSVAREVLATAGALDSAGVVLAHSQPSVTRKHYARVQVGEIRQALESRSGHGNGHNDAKDGASNRDRTGDLQSHNLAL